MKKAPKTAITVMIDKECADKIRKLVFGLKAGGNKISISEVINQSLQKLFLDPDILEAYGDLLQ